MPARKFVDTNIWLYALVQSSENDSRHEKAARLLEEIARPVVSTQVIRESCNNLIKAGIPENSLKALISGWYQDCEVNEATESQFLLASNLRESFSFSHWDSLIVAAALDAGCETLYSEDMQHGQVIEGKLTIINPLI